MSWERLAVVAARAPRVTGVVISPPAVQRSEDKQIFVLHNVNDATPCLGIPTTIEELIEAGFVALPEAVGAEVGKVAIVATRSFLEALSDCGFKSTFSWKTLAAGMSFAYLPVELVKSWCTECAARLLAWSRVTITRLVASSYSVVSARSKVETILRQVRFVTERNSQQRMEMYLLLAVLFRRDEPERWNVVADLLQRESGIGRDELKQLADNYESQTLKVPHKLELFNKSARKKTLAPIYSFGHQSL